MTHPLNPEKALGSWGDILVQNYNSYYDATFLKKPIAYFDKLITGSGNY
jgi:hypothetical protein